MELLADQDLGKLVSELAQLAQRAVAVRETGRVAQVQEVLVRDLHEALVKHGQPADAGVEQRNGAVSVWSGHAMDVRTGHPAPLRPGTIPSWRGW